jgi:SAM-dependent MidA family methyltransferase
VANPEWLTVREAWSRALYGPEGFYRREQPADHFRTSPQASVVFAEAIATLARRWSVTTVVDVGAGGGELLAGLHSVAPDLDLLGVELRSRPSTLPASIRWQQGSGQAMVTSPTEGTLVIANEVLDNLPCDVVEVDEAGLLRLVEVHRTTGEERLGPPASPSTQAWVHHWWEVERPGDRAEVGLARDEWWGDLVSHWPDAVCVAVDYGHVAPHRPVAPTLASYRRGRSYEPTFDAAHDVTADVAVDSVASRVGAVVTTQREVLRDLGLTGVRPPIDDARRDPAGYVRALSRATQIAELTDSPGLGDFWWIVTGRPMGA